MAADAQIATAAARAGMAGAPTNLSQTFQSMATGYASGMEKMGAGLAKAAEVGTIAAQGAIEAAKARKELYGDHVISTGRQSLKHLVQDSFDILKKRTRVRYKDPVTGKYDRKKDTFEEWGEDETENNKTLAKDEWKKKKELTFRSFKNLRDGTTLLEDFFSGEAMNMAELEGNPVNAAIAEVMLLKGDEVQEGPLKGLHFRMEENEDGTDHNFNIYGPNGEIVTGLNEDGTPEYGGETSIAEDRAISSEAKAPIGVETEEFLKGWGTLERSARTSITSLLGGEIEPEGLTSDDVENVQWALQDMGFTPGTADGVWGPKTQKAFNLLKKKEQEARSERAGSLWDQISAQGKPQLSITADEIKGLGVVHSVENESAMIAIDQTAIENGTKGGAFRENETRNQIKKIVNSPEAFRDMAYTNLADMEYTYAEQLGMPNELTAEMWAGVNTMFGDSMSGLDSNEDGKLDAGDFTGSDAANMAILRKAMLDPKNPAAKGLFVDWYTNGVKKSHQTALDKYNAKKEDNNDNNNNNNNNNNHNNIVPFTGSKSHNPTGLIPSNQRGYSQSLMNNYQAQIVDRAPVDSLDEDNPMTFTWDADQDSYTTPDGDPVSKQELFNNIFGNPITNDFMMEDYYRSIKDWTAYTPAPPTVNIAANPFGEGGKANSSPDLVVF